ncbi:prolipoprotein diacylglyceryl transferase [Candidatus Woesearchaeota archaeon]|nr:prolipoprotein diacylglyceryl transferase [Candidatus Woesearchaeota archaeon]
MIDFHTHPENWGIKPVLFSIGSSDISSYSFFVLLALIIGLLVYYFLSAEQKELSEKSFLVLLAALFGGTLGAKIPIWVINYQLIMDSLPDITPIISGRTITGGLVGGTLAVIIVKKYLKIKKKKGNLFAPAIAIGIAIGRIGCFLMGCCYGIETTLPLGVDFGDGILRHPTQIYEAVFMLGLFVFLMYKRKTAKPGQLFFILMNSYFVFRFLEEFIRDNPHYFGLTLFQYISIGALLFINTKYIYEQKKLKIK